MIRRIFALILAVGIPLSVRAATPTTSFNAGSLLVQQYGNGDPALVLIPGLSDSGKVWDTTVARYSGSHRIYVLTLPGFGGRTPIAAPMLDKVDADIAAFLPKANKPVIIGHSMGGFLAIRLAEEHSDLIRGAIAADGLPVFSGMDTMTVAQRAAIANRSSAQLADLTPAQMLAAEKNFVLPYMTKAQNVNLVASFSEGADPKATAQYENELIAADLRPQLGRISVPLLEIAPFDAGIDPHNPSKSITTLAAKRAYYQSLLAGDPTARVQAIANSRHFVMYDQPAAFFAAIDSFLKGL